MAITAGADAFILMAENGPFRPGDGAVWTLDPVPS
jgi:hypothetical protein